MIKKILIATLIIYYGYEGYAMILALDDKPCMGWICEEGKTISCPDEYAIWIPEENAFLPCKHWNQFVNIGNRSILK